MTEKTKGNIGAFVGNLSGTLCGLKAIPVIITVAEAIPLAPVAFGVGLIGLAAPVIGGVAGMLYGEKHPGFACRSLFMQVMPGLSEKIGPGTKGA